MISLSTRFMAIRFMAVPCLAVPCFTVPWQLLFMVLVFASSLSGQETKSKIAPSNFIEHIKPILRQHCLKCHGEDKQESDLNLQEYGALLRGGSGGKAVVAGRASQSLLIEAITNADEDARMPPNSPRLSKEKIDLIRNWINSGLRETAAGKSMTVQRDLTFEPAANAGKKPVGPPAMPEDLVTVKLPKFNRPLPVLAADSSLWAPLLAVSGQDHVRLINTDSEKEIGRLAFPEGQPNVIRFSRNGSVLMVAGGKPVEQGSVVLFDVRTGKRLAKIGDEVDAVLAADLSPDQSLVALGGSGRVVKVYSTTDGKLQYKLTKHTDWITAVAFSPDGSYLATSDRAGGIHLWDAKEGGIVLNFIEHKASVRGLDWRNDSKLLVSVGDDGRIVWWDVTDGFPVINKANAHPPQRPSGSYGIIPNGVLAVRFYGDGNLVTSGRDGVVRLWAPNGNQFKSFKVSAGLPISVTSSHNQKKMISGDTSGTVRFWKTK